MPETWIPNQLLDRADLLESECRIKQEQGVNWRGRERALGSSRPGGGSTLDRWIIVHFMAGLERRRAETGSLL